MGALRLSSVGFMALPVAWLCWSTPGPASAALLHGVWQGNFPCWADSPFCWWCSETWCKGCSGWPRVPEGQLAKHQPCQQARCEGDLYPFPAPVNLYVINQTGILIAFTIKQILPEFCSKLNFILNNVNYSNKISSICHEL